MGMRKVFPLPAKPAIPHSPQLTVKFPVGNRLINITRHSHLRPNEFIRTFLGKVSLAESKACGKTKKAPSFRSGQQDGGGHSASSGGVAHGQPLVTPFRSGSNEPRGAVHRSRTLCGDTTGTQSACWEQATHTTLDAGSGREEGRQS